MFYGSRDWEYVIQKRFLGIVYSETRYSDVILDLNGWEGDWRA